VTPQIWVGSVPTGDPAPVYSKSSVLQERPWYRVVDAVDIPELRVSDSLVQRKARREERDENVAQRPVLHIHSAHGVSVFAENRGGHEKHLPSSKITLLPDILISTAPIMRSTGLVRISLIGFDLALRPLRTPLTGVAVFQSRSPTTLIPTFI
jgi:hypothetical protein